MNEFGDAQCTGKERFRSFRRAQAVARRVASRHEHAADAYSCRYCGGFHIGRTDRRQVKSRAAKHAKMR